MPKTVAESLSTISELLLGQILAVTNTDVKGDELKEEVFRADAVANLAGKMLDVNKTIITAAKVQAEFGGRGSTVGGFKLIGNGTEKD